MFLRCIRLTGYHENLSAFEDLDNFTQKILAVSSQVVTRSPRSCLCLLVRWLPNQAEIALARRDLPLLATTRQASLHLSFICLVPRKSTFEHSSKAITILESHLSDHSVREVTAI